MLITDRTLNDVEQAKNIRLSKVQNFLELTEEDLQILERGYLTINTLNRIENFQKDLQLTLAIMRYMVDVETKQWSHTDFFYAEDFERILKNLENIQKGFFETSTQIPNMNVDYNTLNNVEQILSELINIINDVKNNYYRCGTFECGEVI